jgi:hypothetical protein
MSKDLATFGRLLRASIGVGEQPGVMHHPQQGGQFHLPLTTAALVAGDEAAGRELVGGPVSWLAGDSDGSPIMSRINIVPTSQSRGKLVVGAALPGSSMQRESFTAALGRGVAFPTTPAPVPGDLFRFTADVDPITNAVDEDGGALTTATADQTFRFDGTSWVRTPALFAEREFELSSTVEAKSEVSRQLVVQSGDGVLDDLLEAHRISIADRLLEQILSGDGAGNNLAGIASVIGIGAAEYMAADRGGSDGFQDGEDAVEDGGGRLGGMAWAAGSSLSSSARRAILEPGSDRRVEERARLSLSGLPIQRITTGLAATTGILADWSLIYVPILSELLVVSDLVTNPGDVRVTTRLSCADPIVAHPNAVFSLTEA